jgi:predicted GNAT family acetyltransferase
MNIHHHSEGNKGCFVAMDGNTEAGHMTYSQAGADKIIIDHTEVNPAFNGKGVGKQLVMAAVAYAREHHLKIMPLCPFAKSVFDKTPEILDVEF